MTRTLREGISCFARDFAPKPKPARSPAEAAAILAAKSIDDDFKTMKEASKVLWECRNDVENYLANKRLTVAVGLGGRFVKRILMSGAGFGGGLVGSVVPVVGSTVGGVLGANAVDTFVPGYDLVPNTDLVARIETARQGLFDNYLTPKYYQEEARNFIANDVGNRVINGVLECLAGESSPVSVPVVWMYSNFKDLKDVKDTSKLDLVVRLKASLKSAESMLSAVDSRFSAAFDTHKRRYTSDCRIAAFSKPKDMGYGVKVTLDSWVWERVYRRYKDKVLAELRTLHQLVINTERKYLSA